MELIASAWTLWTEIDHDVLGRRPAWRRGLRFEAGVVAPCDDEVAEDAQSVIGVRCGEGRDSGRKIVHRDALAVGPLLPGVEGCHACSQRLWVEVAVKLPGELVMVHVGSSQLDVIA